MNQITQNSVVASVTCVFRVSGVGIVGIGGIVGVAGIVGVVGVVDVAGVVGVIGWHWYTPSMVCSKEKGMIFVEKLRKEKKQFKMCSKGFLIYVKHNFSKELFNGMWILFF